MKSTSKLAGLALAAGLVAGGVMGTAGIASADANTTTTFTIDGGALTVSAPASVDLGSVDTGSASIADQLGPVTVTDLRGALESDWTASVSASAFTTGTATAHETVAASDVDYLSGSATATTGLGTFTAGGAQTDLSADRLAFEQAGGTGNNSATWNPEITLNLSASQVAGDYTGTVVHSVA